MFIRWEQRMWYLRIEIKKEDLQDEVLERCGVYISDPENLVQLSQLLPPWTRDCQIYEEPTDDGLLIIVEVYG
jgi:hypothetical protein